MSTAAAIPAPAYPLPADGGVLDVAVLGLASFADDVTPALARQAIGSLHVLGSLQASPDVKTALADRMR